ncbi:putative kinesin [Trypanosoma rangeli]|uniref:Putative kinesin n=1 Tax=Trypanosoma rangeli TaxID=5698 RepID=A0A422NQD5_TRYRA|nr:putative kinesin [Trypanosoma rangeli]RNF07675.1 putative kinesin [Trypanosoma rangeli]|eukprot:RNF07675.1 putative kinesin [Trypanosoma rangeli]
MASESDMAVLATSGVGGEEGDAAKVLAQKEWNAVGVMARVRPLSTVEHADPSVKSILHCLKDGIVVHGVPTQSPSRYFGVRHAKPRSQYFKVDEVFHPHSTQLEVYEACRNVVAGVFDGINGSILAYGATGSGKTHTMFGSNMSVAGVIYQGVRDILEEKERLEVEEQKVVKVRCTFLEVYNEEVFDLLVPSSSSGKRIPLKLQDFGQEDSFHDGERSGANLESLSVKSLTHVTPQTAEDFAKLVELGQANRFVASTNVNAQSSRSHAILTLEVEVKDTVDATLGTVGRIRFCDLAGSERAAGTSNSGIRLQEGGNINRSLLALGTVVQALIYRSKHPDRVNYIPYRGSKLTRLLRDCFGGNCRTLMLFCVSPSSKMYEETINTMLFAMQAKDIQVSAKRHEFRVDSKEVTKSQEALIDELRLELAQTQDELLRLRGGSPEAALNRSVMGRQSSQLVADSFSPMPILTPCKGEQSPPPGASTIAMGNDIRLESLETSPTMLHTSRRLSTRVTLGVLGSDAYTALQKKLKKFSVAKETLYRAMRETQEANSELDIRLRQHKWKLARFLAARRKSAAGDANEEKATPVGVAGLRLAIEKMEMESATQGGKMEELLEKMNDTDRTIAGIRQELLGEKQHPLLELLMDNVKLRQSCTEAECLAAHYHQECRSIMNREEEYMQALSVCISVIRHMLPLASGVSHIMDEAKLALMFANLPSLSTMDMIPFFERSMKTGHTPSISLLDAHRAFSPVETIEARIQRLVEGRGSGKNSVARQPSHCRAQCQTKGTPSSKAHVGNASPKVDRIPFSTGPTRSRSEPFVTTHSTTSLRQPVENGFATAKNPVGFDRTPSANAKKVAFVGVTKKSVTSAPAPRSHLRNGSKGAPVKRATSQGTRAATASAAFSRSHTASEAPHVRMPKNGGLSLVANEGHNRERVRKLQNSPSLNHSSFLPNSDGNVMPLRRNRVAFQLPAEEGASSLPQRRLQNTDLEERFTRLLTEVQQWHIGTAAAPVAKGNHTTLRPVTDIP